MADNWSLVAAHAVNKYLWNALQAVGWTSDWYGENSNLVPIVPAGMSPEFNDYNTPYVTYRYTDTGGTDEYWYQEQQVSYTVYSSDEEDIRKFINIAREALGKGDRSADMINRYVASNPTLFDGHYRRFDYKNISIVMSYSAQPPTSEGGRMDGGVSIKIKYTFYEPDDAAVPPGVENERAYLT